MEDQSRCNFGSFIHSLQFFLLCWNLIKRHETDFHCRRETPRYIDGRFSTNCARILWLTEWLTAWISSFHRWKWTSKGGSPFHRLGINAILFHLIYSRHNFNGSFFVVSIPFHSDLSFPLAARTRWLVPWLLPFRMGGSKRNRRWNLIKNESSNRQYLGTYSPDDAHLFGSRQRYVLWSPLALPRRYLFTYFQTLFSCSFVFFWGV